MRTQLVDGFFADLIGVVRFLGVKFIKTLENSLMIHKENTKEITTVAVVSYVIKTLNDLPKFDPWFSRLL